MTQRLIFKWKTILGLTAALWIIECINLLLGHQLNQFGLIPRQLAQWWGIFTTPFLHANPMHLMANTPPFLFLGGLVMGLGYQRFWLGSVVIILLGGIGVWLFGRPSIHVGASGWIFGLFGFLLATAWWEKSLYTVLLAGIAVFLYGGLIWGVLPTRGFVSWEGHLFGFLAGLVAGALLHRKTDEPIN